MGINTYVGYSATEQMANMLTYITGPAWNTADGAMEGQIELEKQIIVKGRSRLIKIADQDMDYDERFRLYMTSRLANPHFSPELAAKATIIDFTVTQGGLEQ